MNYRPRIPRISRMYAEPQIKRFVRFVRFVFEKIIFVVSFPPKSVLNPPCPAKAQSKPNENQKINQTKNQKTNPCKRLRCISDIRECFLILSSVAAGLQSARQQ